jgi:hypothetical protein
VTVNCSEEEKMNADDWERIKKMADGADDWLKDLHAIRDKNEKAFDVIERYLLDRLGPSKQLNRLVEAFNETRREP